MSAEDSQEIGGRLAWEYLSKPEGELPPPMPAEEALQPIIDALEVQEGITFSLYFGVIANVPLYAASLYPEASILMTGKTLGVTQLRSFIRRQEALLRDPRHCIGVWYDAEADETYLDISVLFLDREEAIHQGHLYNQVSIYDFEQARVWETGGTGEALVGLPSLNERLPTPKQTGNHGNHHNHNNDAGS